MVIDVEWELVNLKLSPSVLPNIVFGLHVYADVKVMPICSVWRI